MIRKTAASTSSVTMKALTVGIGAYHGEGDLEVGIDLGALASTRSTRDEFVRSIAC